MFKKSFLGILGDVAVVCFLIIAATFYTAGWLLKKAVLGVGSLFEEGLPDHTEGGDNISRARLSFFF